MRIVFLQIHVNLWKSRCKTHNQGVALVPPRQSSPRLNWSTGPIINGESRFEPIWAHQSPSRFFYFEGLFYLPRNQALAYKAPPELYYTASLGGFFFGARFVPGFDCLGWWELPLFFTNHFMKLYLH